MFCREAWDFLIILLFPAFFTAMFLSEKLWPRDAKKDGIFFGNGRREVGETGKNVGNYRKESEENYAAI